MRYSYVYDKGQQVNHITMDDEEDETAAVTANEAPSAPAEDKHTAKSRATSSKSTSAAPPTESTPPTESIPPTNSAERTSIDSQARIRAAMAVIEIGRLYVNKQALADEVGARIGL
jgi:anti-sigma28 factor (negative regulator of flagellin synthesis)